MDPFLDFPYGGTIGNIGLPSNGVGLARMKKGNHPALTILTIALTIEYQRTRVALVAERLLWHIPSCADFGKSRDSLRFRKAVTRIEIYTVGCIVSDFGMAIIPL